MDRKKTDRKTVLITGSSGFIGSYLVTRMKKNYDVIGLDKNSSTKSNGSKTTIEIEGDLSDQNFLESMFEEYLPDVVVHCAGIAHQNMAIANDRDIYSKVNYKATIDLAKKLAACNPNVHFIFLSSISVYGEKGLSAEVSEEMPCYPTTEYAKSKLDAEEGLLKLFNRKVINKLDIFRLAPVYDYDWSLNLDKRVLGPKSFCYLKLGDGNQKMSILSRMNLCEFIKFRIENSSYRGFSHVFNITDKSPCSFNEMIEVFKNSSHKPFRFTLRVPLSIVWIITRIAGFFHKSNANWYYSCYNKVADDLVFSNTKMLGTGFAPVNDLNSVFGKR